MKVYFNEYNLVMGNAIYLPIVSGQLQAYAQKQKGYEFMPIHFKREPIDVLVKKHKKPEISAFSCSMWNMNLSLKVAKLVKENNPDCLIIFGGANVPFDADEFLKKYSFIDLTVRGEGEIAFDEILIENKKERNFSNIKGISYRSGRKIIKTKDRELIKDLDVYPSPYLEGVFDELIKNNKYSFQAIVETNRGCPYNCAYCFWGWGGMGKKYRFFSVNRIKKIADWIAKNKIEYVFCSDSNFGMFPRDLDIAKIFVKVKKKYNYPDKFRVCYSKNSQDTVFKIGELFHKNKLDKSVTLSRQSDNKSTLKVIGRDNIEQLQFNKLQHKCNKKDIPVYTELIIGLPNESYNSFVNGVENILKAGIQNQLFMYHCQVYPNTTLNNPNYINKYKIKTIKLPLSEVHCIPRKNKDIVEYERIIIGTETMPTKDWKKTQTFSWIVQLLHGLKLGFFINNYLVDKYKLNYTDLFETFLNTNKKTIKKEIKELETALDNILKGKEFCTILKEFGDIYWEHEEASYLRISKNKDLFFTELYEIVKELLNKKKICFDEEELKEVIQYQKIRIPNYKNPKQKEYEFKYNVGDYFDKFFTKKIKLINKENIVKLKNIERFNNNKKEFAKKTILWGRKSGRTLYEVEK